MKKKLFFYAIAPFIGIWFFPILCCYLISDRRGLIDSDVERWKAHQPQIYKEIDFSVVSFLITICLRTEFRKQVIWRLGGGGKMLVLNMIYGNCSSLYMERPARIGKGLMVVHGNGTVIGGGSVIGNNLTIYQNATIGFHNGFPTIGDNVFIGAGAIVIGKIKVGNNVKIGAGAVVVNDVPDNCTVVGPKAKIISQRDTSST
ncbi:MAG: serine O-acetyltransferase [Prevotella sp.]